MWNYMVWYVWLKYNKNGFISYILYIVPSWDNNQMEQEIIKRFIKYWIQLKRQQEFEMYKYREWCEEQDDSYENEKIPNRVGDFFQQ